MSPTDYLVELDLPFRCQAASEENAHAESHWAEVMRGNRLLLRALNSMEMPEPADMDRHLERLESKLDLALHWLGLSLHGQTPGPALQRLRLYNEGVAWQGHDPGLVAGTTLVLTLHPSPLLAGPLTFAATLTETATPWARAEFLFADEAFQDAWSQWLFRRHRRAIQASRRGLSPD